MGLSSSLLILSGDFVTLAIGLPMRRGLGMGMIGGGAAVLYAALMVAAGVGDGAPVVGADRGHPVDLVGSAPWDVRYDDEVCHLSRAFGTGDEQTVLRLTEHSPGPAFDLLLASKLLSPVKSIIFMRIAFGDQEVQSVRPPNVEESTLPVVLLGARSLVPYAPALKATLTRFYGMQTWTKTEDEAAVTSFTFQAPSGRWYRLRTGSMAAPMKAMRDCMDDLVKSWGYDPAQQAALTRPPEPVGAEPWLNSGDFPLGAINKGGAGLVLYRLDVDEKGKATGCHVQASVGDEAYRQATCVALEQRAHFKPALDAQGKPVRSFFARKQGWTVLH